MFWAFILGQTKTNKRNEKPELSVEESFFFFCRYDPKEAEIHADGAARFRPMNLPSCLTLTNVGSVCTDVSTWPCREAHTEATSPLTLIYCTATLLHTPVVSPQRSQICPISSFFLGGGRFPCSQTFPFSLHLSFSVRSKVKLLDTSQNSLLLSRVKADVQQPKQEAVISC